MMVSWRALSIERPAIFASGWRAEMELVVPRWGSELGRKGNKRRANL